jgi:hypothetical protein
VRLVYMDEAGISNPKHEPFLTFAGIVVDADSKLNAIEKHLESLISRHIPERLRHGFIFHATEIFTCGKILRKQHADFIGPWEWPLDRRLKIADDIAAMIKKFDLPIAMGFLERAKFRADFDFPDEFPPSEEVVAQIVSTFMNSAMVAEHWMRKNAKNENCLLIVEDNKQARETIRQVHNHRQDKKLAEVLDEQSLRHFPLRKIKEDPLFQPKKPTSPLIIADFCAYVFKRVLMKDGRYDRFFNPIRHHLISFEPGWFERPRGKRVRTGPSFRRG